MRRSLLSLTHTHELTLIHDEAWIGLVYTVHTAMGVGTTSTGESIAFDAGHREAAPRGDLEVTPEHFRYLVEQMVL